MRTLVAFALEVGSKSARLEQEREWVETLRQFEEQMWPGIEFDLVERFASRDEKMFWSHVFRDVAQGIFLRELGNQAETFWQASAIGDATIIQLMLIRGARLEE